MTRLDTNTFVFCAHCEHAVLNCPICGRDEWRLHHKSGSLYHQAITLAAQTEPKAGETLCPHGFNRPLECLRCQIVTIEHDRDAWKNAIIDAAVVDWVYTNEHDTNPRKAVNDLLAWQVKIALDQAVSKDAHDLHERIGELEREVAELRQAAAADEARSAFHRGLYDK